MHGHGFRTWPMLIMKENIVTDYATEKERWFIQMEKYLKAFLLMMKKRKDNILLSLEMCSLDHFERR